MRLLRCCPHGALVLGVLLGLAPPAAGRTVTLKEPAKVREGASRFTPLIADLPAGTTVDVVGEEGGWLKVIAPDGRSGWVWGEHVRTEGGAAEDRPPESPRRSDPVAREPPPTPADLLSQLRADVAALRERPEPATSADLERVRAEVERLTEGQRDLARRLDERGGLGDGPTEGAAGLAWTSLVVGAVVGWVLGLFAHRRRTRRQRQRVRL